MDREICHAVGESQLCIVNIRGTVERVKHCKTVASGVVQHECVATAGVHH